MDDLMMIGRKRSGLGAVLLFAWSMAAQGSLLWEKIPSLPDPVGVAGPYVGVHNGSVIVAGGANFPVRSEEDLWQVPKQWHADAYVLTGLAQGKPQWFGGFRLDRPAGYGAVVSAPQGVVCMGGDDANMVFSSVFLLRWDGDRLIQTPLPELPRPCAYGSAALIGNTVYLAGGQSGSGLKTAMNNFWSLDLSRMNAADGSFRWQELPPWPGPERAFNLTVAQHNGFETCVYVISGRRQLPGTDGISGVEALKDVYEYNPAKNQWRRRADVPVPIMAGTGAAVGQSHLFVLSGADGTLMTRVEELKDDHPGFPRRAWAYHTITDTWTDAGETPCNQVTTPVVRLGDDLILVSGETRPRVRTAEVWKIRVAPRQVSGFGAINFSVLIVYLAAMIGVGFYFMRKNRNTDDYFRGGQQIPWWVAGCSIFATMLSSITFIAIPAKAYAQDMILALSSALTICVAPLAVYLALPFFRRIDATSAYEYLEKRFNRPVRLLASGVFSVFHIFRMGIVMSLGGLALTTLTPLTPVQSVLIMGVLSMLYCTLGGLEAVVWTDTLQTVVLLGGALLCFVIIIFKLDGGISEMVHIAFDDGKFRFIDPDFSLTSYTRISAWVIIVGAFGRNISSYISDQSIVQRYMSTRDQKTAARSIWMNAWLSIPASLLFFGMGTALYVYYKTHPGQLDPMMNTDQIFPLFISTQVPVGIAGLIVAGIFAAAQSTVSTSMNSTATTLVTDFLQPFQIFKSDLGYLRAGRVLTFGLGIAGTLLGLLFVSPGITSLFDVFLNLIGLFLGILGGLFCLGMLTRRANGAGALSGLLCATLLLWVIRRYTLVHWFLYSSIGGSLCFVLGYLFSLIFPFSARNIDGLTVHTVVK